MKNFAKKKHKTHQKIKLLLVSNLNLILLPVFLQMFNDIYSGHEETNWLKISSKTEKFVFN